MFLENIIQMNLYQTDNHIKYSNECNNVKNKKGVVATDITEIQRFTRNF